MFDTLFIGTETPVTIQRFEFLFWGLKIVFFFFFFFFFLRSFSPTIRIFGVQAGTALYRSTRYIDASTNEVGVYIMVSKEWCPHL